jgi:hypothetical protein
MDVYNFLSIVYKAYEPTESTAILHQNVYSRESFNGLIIESYCGIFCNKIITRFGNLRLSDYATSKDYQTIDEYIKSRISYKRIIKVVSGNYGPFYLVTHIDGIPVENDCVDGINCKNFYQYITNNPDGRTQYPEYITDIIKQGLVKDKSGIIERLLVEPEYYPEAVKLLIKDLPNPEYFEVLDVNIYYHIFGLLSRNKLL